MTIAICDDLENAIGLFERLEADWEKTKTIWFSTINEIKESRQRYQSSKDSVVLYNNAELRKRIAGYYFKSSETISSLEYQQNRKYELSNKIEAVAKDIQSRQEVPNPKAAYDLAASVMKSEFDDLGAADQRIREFLNKLAQSRTEARSLLERLRSEM